MTLYLFLAPSGNDCRVLLDDVDISPAVRGIELTAHAGQLTEVRLTLLANVEVIGDAARIITALAQDIPNQE